MPERKVLTIVVSRPGAVRESLRAVLSSFSQLEVIGAVGGGLSAMNKIREQRPSLLVIDGNFAEDEVVALLAQVRQEQPQVRCVVLVETSRQRGKVLSAGAHAVLQRGDPLENLQAAIERLTVTTPPSQVSARGEAN
jgi:DNA-binding NarL/FixJ family response regulator